jgi:hypothetical protein
LLQHRGVDFHRYHPVAAPEAVAQIYKSFFGSFFSKKELLPFTYLP